MRRDDASFADPSSRRNVERNLRENIVEFRSIGRRTLAQPFRQREPTKTSSATKSDRSTSEVNSRPKTIRECRNGISSFISIEFVQEEAAKRHQPLKRPTTIGTDLVSTRTNSERIDANRRGTSPTTNEVILTTTNLSSAGSTMLTSSFC